MTDKGTSPAVGPVEDELVDEVVERLMDRADASGATLLGEGGLLTAVTRAVLERALDAEMTEHLGYQKHDPAGRGSGNSRNGVSSKTILTDDGEVEITGPRPRRC
jgi:transposase-like protein